MNTYFRNAIELFEVPLFIKCNPYQRLDIYDLETYDIASVLTCTHCTYYVLLTKYSELSNCRGWWYKRCGLPISKKIINVAGNVWKSVLIHYNRDHSTKIDKRGRSNKGMAGRFFLKNKYPWRHGNSIAQSS